MDLLSGLASLMGGSSQSGAQRQGGGLENMLTGILGAAGGQGSQGGGLGALGGLLNPSVLGGLASALMGGGAPSGASGGAGDIGNLLGSLFGGTSTPALDRHGDAVMQADPRYGKQAASAPANRVTRLLRAMIYAAKADGHIDQSEQDAVTSFLQKNNVGQEGMRIIQGMINEPLDPRAIADGLQDSREAAQIYGMSCVVCGNDHPDERRYLDDLARTMGVPAKVKADIERQIGF